MYAVSFTMIPASGLFLYGFVCIYWVVFYQCNTTILGTVVLLLYPVYSTVLLLVV